MLRVSTSYSLEEKVGGVTSSWISETQDRVNSRKFCDKTGRRIFVTERGEGPQTHSRELLGKPLSGQRGNRGVINRNIDLNKRLMEERESRFRFLIPIQEERN